MNWLDYLLVFIIGFSILQGIWRGFSRMAILFAGTLVGLFVAAWHYGALSPRLAPHVSSDLLARFLAFLAIFVAVQLAASLLSWALGKLVKASGLTGIDRLLGGAFGLLRSFIICTVVLLGLMAFPFRPVAELIAKSELAPFVIGVANTAASLAPQELRDGFMATYERVKQIWENPSPKAAEKSTV